MVADGAFRLRVGRARCRAKRRAVGPKWSCATTRTTRCFSSCTCSARAAQSATGESPWNKQSLKVLGRQNYVDEHDLGELLTDVDTIFGEHDVRRPDLFYFTKARRRFIGEKAIEGPPDLAVEVLSPGSERTDRRDKFKLYAAGGVKQYWIV